MSERERWIVYPLLFFALGAALRDKYTQQVQTDSLHAKRISCEELFVIDSENEKRVVAELGSRAPTVGDGESPDQFGVLVLRDSQGKEFFGATNEVLQVRHIACDELNVVDPGSNVALARLGSVAYPQGIGGAIKRFGVLVLNNQRYLQVLGFPAADQPNASPAKSPAPAAPAPKKPEESAPDD